MDSARSARDRSRAPDGARIVYTSGLNGGSSGNTGAIDIWVTNADDSGKIANPEAPSRFDIAASSAVHPAPGRTGFVRPSGA